MESSGLLSAHPEIAYGALILLQFAIGIVVSQVVYTFKREIGALKEADEKLETRISTQLRDWKGACAFHETRLRDVELGVNRNFVEVSSLSTQYEGIAERLDRLETKIDKLIGLNGRKGGNSGS